MEEKWKLGEDLSVEDNLLDGFTFRDIILTVHCNCREITPDAIRKEVLALLELRIDDLKCLLERNMDVIAEEAKKGREV